MLFLLIPIAWMLVASFVLLLCRASARGDASPGRPAGLAQPRATAAGLTLWEDPPVPELSMGETAAPADAPPARRNGTRGSLVHR